MGKKQRKINRAVRRAAADGRVTRQESRQIRRAGGGSSAVKQARTQASRPAAQRQTATRQVTRKSGSSKQTQRQTQQANSWQANPILQLASGASRNQDYANLLASRGMTGAFDAASWARAQAAGFSDTEIRNALEAYRQGPQGSLMIGVRPEAVLNDWQNMNPEAYRQFAQGPAAQFSAPGQVLFNPLGETNVGMGRGGLQDRGITWYSTQGNQDNDLSRGNMPVSTAMNTLESGYYLNTPEGRQRMMIGESPVPTRYMGDPRTGRPSSMPGSTPFGYNTFTSPSALAYQANLGYRGSWMPG